MEGDKLKGRDKYIITDITQEHAKIQKIDGRLFSSRKYVVPLTHIIPLTTPYRQHKNELHDPAEEPYRTKLTEHTNVKPKPHYFEWNNINTDSDSDSDDYTLVAQTPNKAVDDIESDNSVDLAPEALEIERGGNNEVGEIDEHGIFGQGENELDQIVEEYDGNDQQGEEDHQQRRSCRQRGKPPWHKDYILEQL